MSSDASVEHGLPKLTTHKPEMFVLRSPRDPKGADVTLLES